MKICFLLLSERGRQGAGTVIPPTWVTAVFTPIYHLQKRRLEAFSPVLLISGRQFLGGQPGPKQFIGSTCCRRNLQFSLRFLRPSASSIGGGHEIVRSRRLKEWL